MSFKEFLYVDLTYTFLLESSPLFMMCRYPNLHNFVHAVLLSEIYPFPLCGWQGTTLYRGPQPVPVHGLLGSGLYSRK